MAPRSCSSLPRSRARAACHASTRASARGPIPGRNAGCPAGIQGISPPRIGGSGATAGRAPPPVKAMARCGRGRVAGPRRGAARSGRHHRGCGVRAAVQVAAASLAAQGDRVRVNRFAGPGGHQLEFGGELGGIGPPAPIPEAQHRAGQPTLGRGGHAFAQDGGGRAAHRRKDGAGGHAIAAGMAPGPVGQAVCGRCRRRRGLRGGRCDRAPQHGGAALVESGDARQAAALPGLLAGLAVGLGPALPGLHQQLVLRDLEGAEDGAHEAHGLQMAQAAGRVAPGHARPIGQVGHRHAAGGAMAPGPTEAAAVHPAQQGVGQALEAVAQAAVHDPPEDVQGQHPVGSTGTRGEGGHADPPHPRRAGIHFRTKDPDNAISSRGRARTRTVASSPMLHGRIKTRRGAVHRRCRPQVRRSPPSADPRFVPRLIGGSARGRSPPARLGSSMRMSPRRSISMRIAEDQPLLRVLVPRS